MNLCDIFATVQPPVGENDCGMEIRGLIGVVPTGQSRAPEWRPFFISEIVQTQSRAMLKQLVCARFQNTPSMRDPQRTRLREMPKQLIYVGCFNINLIYRFYGN